MNAQGPLKKRGFQSCLWEQLDWSAQNSDLNPTEHL